MMPLNPLIKRKTFSVFILSLPVLASLICGSVFIYKTLFSFWLYGLATIALVVWSALRLLKNPVLITHLFNLPVLFFTLLYLWFLIWPMFHITSNGNLKDFVILFGFLNAISLVVLLNLFQRSIHLLFLLLFLYGVFESLICLGQLMGLISSASSWFNVTGTFPNPNITAIFLVLMLPIHGVLRNHFHQKSHKILFLVGFVTIVLAIIVLKCRTAWLGASVALISAVFAIKSIQNNFRKQRIVSILILIAVGVVLLSAMVKMYNFKRESAEGRILIWKISSQMFLEKPLSGFGFGLFEKYYNQHQAQYFATNEASIKDINSAGFVRMAYNEYLEIAVEGGIIGVGLFVSLLLSLFITFFKSPPNTNSLAAVTGLVQIAVMSIVNFTIQAIPVMAVFSLFSAIIISSRPVSCRILRHARQSGVLLALFLLGVSVLIIQKHFSLFTSLHLQKKAFDLSSYQTNGKASDMISETKSDLKKCESFYNAAIVIAIREGDMEKAYEIFQTGKEYTSSQNFYLNGGGVCEALGKFKEAENAYLFASNMIPSLLTPKYRLMKLYRNYGQEQKAKIMAEAIMQTQPKIENDKSKEYKNAAKEILTPL